MVTVAVIVTMVRFYHGCQGDYCDNLLWLLVITFNVIVTALSV